MEVPADDRKKWYRQSGRGKKDMVLLQSLDSDINNQSTPHSSGAAMVTAGGRRLPRDSKADAEELAEMDTEKRQRAAAEKKSSVKYKRYRDEK